MIRYRYSSQMQPPAPFVNTTVSCAGTGRSAADQPAQVDPGADRTVIPAALVQTLGLVEDGRLHFQGFAGELVELPIYLVEVAIHNLRAIAVRAALGQNESHILLGRDVLNAYRIVLDGPQLALEIG